MLIGMKKVFLDAQAISSQNQLLKYGAITNRQSFDYLKSDRHEVQNRVNRLERIIFKWNVKLVVAVAPVTCQPTFQSKVQ